MAPWTIRSASPSDARDVAAIYAHYVTTGTASFDLEAPPAHFWTEKIGAIASRGWPFLVAEQRARVVGYAYASQFRDRPAYAATCEDSVYVAEAMTGQGVGSALMAALIEAAKRSGFEQMIAVIGGGEPASVALHAKAGFVEAGRMRNVGRKFGRLLDTVYMQRSLADR